jgi:hypothetical protein
VDGYEAPGGDADLCNRIAVTWTDSRGRPRTTIRTSTVPDLGTRTRDAQTVALPAGQGSLINAQTIGDQILATKAAPPKAATVAVRHPILDMQEGRLIQPWQIQPGYVVRVIDTGDELQCTEVNYTHETRTMNLTLGTPVATSDQLLARLAGNHR